jgi:hypothetical protein
VILPEGNDLVDNLHWRMTPPLRLADLLRVAAPFGDEIDDVEHLKDLIECILRVKRSFVVERHGGNVRVALGRERRVSPRRVTAG